MDADPELDEPAEADDVGGQARGKCAHLAHRAHAGWIGGRDKAGWLVLSRDHGVRNLVLRLAGARCGESHIVPDVAGGFLSCGA
jgi:hypothetical protein